MGPWNLENLGEMTISFSGCGQELWEHPTLGASDRELVSWNGVIFRSKWYGLWGCYGVVWPDILEMFSWLKLLLIEFWPSSRRTHITLTKIVVSQVILGYKWCRWTGPIIVENGLVVVSRCRWLSWWRVSWTFAFYSSTEYSERLSKLWEWWWL
jgi:hypothetical protein